MDDLMVRKLRGEATDLEIRRLERWRSESPENDRDYHEFVSLWNGSGEPEAPVVGPPPPLHEILQAGDGRRTRSGARRLWRVPVRSRSAWYGLGAAALATVLLTTLLSHDNRSAATHALFPVESSSSPGDVTTLGLSDGSVVRMLPQSRVEFPSGANRREVVLNGRAFFAVVADPTPFVVRTAVGEVTVQGTRFEVLADGVELRLVVVEGRVRLDGQAGAADVRAGQVAYLGLGSSPRVVDHGDVWSLLEWRNGLLIFEATPLSTVARELSRHFGRDVTVVDRALDGVRITAWFDDEPIEEVVSAVCLVAVAECEVSAADVVIGR